MLEERLRLGRINWYKIAKGFQIALMFFYNGLFALPKADLQ